MARLRKGWKSDEFRTPDAIWFVRLEGQYWDSGKKKYVKLSGTAVKLTYMCLVRYLDIYGEVFPSINTIAKLTEQSEKNAQRCINYLLKVGLLRKKNRVTAEGMKTSNEYILFHPEQVPGLEIIEVREPRVSGTDAASYLKNMDSDANPSIVGMDAASYPKNLDGSQNPSTFGTDAASYRTDAASHRTDATSDNYNVSPSVSQSVSIDTPTPIPVDPGEEVQEYYQKAFGEQLADLELEEILSFDVDIKKVKEIIRKVALYVDIKTKPFKVLAAAIAAEAQGKPWAFLENVGDTKTKRRKAKTADKQPSDLPSAIRRQQEEAAAAEESEAPANRQAEIRAKLKLMNERFSRKAQEQLP